MSVLFVTWDGPGSEYLSSLYIPMLSRLPCPAHVLQLTYGPKEQGERARRSSLASGVGYRSVRIGTVDGRMWAASLGAASALPRLAFEIRRTKASVVVARSVLPAGLTMLARRLVGRRVGFVFDADGLVQDERVDFLGWSNLGAGYRGLRALEFQALLTADVVLTRTHRAKDILLARTGPIPAPDKIRVVPNGTDEDRFRPLNNDERRAIRRAYGLPEDGLVIVYAGSLGPQYLPEAMFALHRRLPSSTFFVASPQADAARELAARVPPESVRFASVDASEMPKILASSDLGLALRRPSFSQQAVSPIKVGEYLLAGLPVVSTAGVGDLDRLLAHCPAALMVSDSSDRELDRVARWVVSEVSRNGPALREAARSLGLAHFSLTDMVRGYGLAIRDASSG